MDRIIVTRHAALVVVLKEDYGIVGQVHEHATADLVTDRSVVGVLPLHLAALASSVTAVDLELPPELRGKELTVDQVRENLKGLTTYIVRTTRAYYDALQNSYSQGWEYGRKHEATEHEPH